MADDKKSKRGDAAKIGANASKASAKASAKGGAGGGAGSGKRGRHKPAPVKKPFPVGFAAGVTVLVLGLGGILVYAATNVGAGFDSPLDKADAKFTGLRVDDNLSQFHVNETNGTRVDYPGKATRPPDGGNHNPYWYKCGVYTSPIVNEHAVHSLEHGAVWITYRPDLAADQVKVLTDDVNADVSYTMLSPYAGQTAPVMATAWGRSITADTASDPRINEFISTYADGPQNREVGAGCSTGQIEMPGTVPFVVNAEGTGFTAGPTDGPTVNAQGDLPAGEAVPTASGGVSSVPTPGVGPTSLGGTSATPAPSSSASPTAAPTPSTTPTP